MGDHNPWLYCILQLIVRLLVCIDGYYHVWSDITTTRKKDVEYIIRMQKQSINNQWKFKLWHDCTLKVRTMVPVNQDSKTKTEPLKDLYDNWKQRTRVVAVQSSLTSGYICSRHLEQAGQSGLIIMKVSWQLLWFWQTCITRSYVRSRKSIN